MKVSLDKTQSKYLLDLGIPKEKASINSSYYSNKKHCIELYTVFKLEDFLNGEILPKELSKGGDYLTMHGNVVGYAFNIEYEGLIWYVSFKNSELIDALYELTCWYYGKYLKQV